MSEAEKIGNQLLEDLKEPKLVEIPATWRNGALVLKVADVMGDRGTEPTMSEPKHYIVEREYFEEWVSSEEYSTARNTFVADAPYSDPAVELAWQAWKWRAQLVNTTID
jgi:hypothetical protein